MGLERRGRADQGHSEANPSGEEPRARPEPKVKSFEIDKRLIVGAWEKVRANNGAPGVDAVGIGRVPRAAEGQSLQAVEQDELGKLLPGAGAGRGDTERPVRVAGGGLAGGKRTAADLGAWLVFEDESG